LSYDSGSSGPSGLLSWCPGKNLKELPRDAPIPRFQLGDPEHKTQGFFNVSNSVLVFNKSTLLGPLGSALERSGNIHTSRLNDTGEEIFLLNTTAVYNCLDTSQTAFRTPTGQEVGVDRGMGIEAPAFFPDLIGDSWIFRVPQMRSTILVASDGRGGADDFYTSYMESGMQELRFESIWTAS
jgi:hypothetical protein